MTQTATARTAWMSFPVPDGWRLDADAPADAGLVVRRDAPAGDRPAVVVASTEESTLPLADAAVARVRAALDESRGAFVVSCDPCTFGGRPARRILFTRPLDAERDEAVDEVLWATGYRVLRLSARCAVPDLPAVSLQLDDMAAGVVFPDAAGARDVDGERVAQPDADVAHSGVDAGLLAFVASRQRFAPDGPVLPASAARLLARTRKRLAGGRSIDADVDAAALYGLGLVDAAGVLTEAGSAIRSHWRRSKPLLEIRTRGAASGMLTAWLGTRDTVLIGTTPTLRPDMAGVRHPSPAREGTDMRLGMFTLDRALPAVMSWLGVRPTTTSGAEVSMPEKEYEARIAGGSTPVPTGADGALGGVWRTPWVEHRLRSPQSGLIIIDAAPAGFVQVGLRDDTAHMRSVSSRAVFDAVVGIYGAAVADAA